MIRYRAYGLAVTLALAGCVSSPTALDDLFVLPYAEKLQPQRFERNGVVYLAQLRQRSDATPASPPTDFDIAISRVDTPFTMIQADRHAAATAAAVYCAKLGGAHDDRAQPVFRAASAQVGNAEWVFPGWCDLPHPSQVDAPIPPVTPEVTQ